MLIDSYFQNIFFYDKFHTYKKRGDRNFKFQSVTGVKKQFVTPFRKRYWLAYKVAQELYGGYIGHDRREDVPEDHISIKGDNWHIDEIHKLHAPSIQELQDKWTQLKDIGLEKGNCVHWYLENLYKRKLINVPSKYEQIINVATDYWKNDPADVAAMELVCGDFDWKIAGQIDRLDYLDFSKKSLSLTDYKTDKDLTTSNVWDNLLPPFDSFEASTLNEYSIQVCLYALLIERNTPYTIDEMKIVNFTDTGWEIFQPTDFRQILSDYFNNQTA